MAFQSNDRAEQADEPAPMPDINVTPFIDVMLVLLIIFMVTAPMMAQGMKVDLPRSTAAKPLEPARPVIVTVGPAGEIQVGDQTVGLGGLVAAVRSARENQATPIQVRGDSNTAYGNVVAVFDVLTASGLSGIVLAFERAAARRDAAD